MYILPGTVQVEVHESSIEPMHKHKKLIYEININTKINLSQI